MSNPIVRCVLLALLPLPLVASAQERTALEPPVPTRLLWSDVDGDGLSDAFVVELSGRGRVLRNTGLGRFEDVTLAVGLAPDMWVRDALLEDLDGDGAPELVLAEASGGLRLWRNAGGVFEEWTASSGLAADLAALSLDSVDLDEDGVRDLHVSTLWGHALFRGVGNLAFERLEVDAAEDVVLSHLAPGAPTTPAALAEAPAPEPAARWSSDATPLARPASGAPSAAATGGSERLPSCLPGIRDDFNGACMRASSKPTYGMLCPLGDDFYIDSASGFVGIGTTLPGANLDVAGLLRASDTIVSTKAAGAPFLVASSALNANLNADLLDGVDSAAFSQFGAEVDTAELADGAVTNIKLGPSSVSGSRISNGAVSNQHVSASAAIAGTKVDPDFGSQDVVTLGQMGVGTAPGLSMQLDVAGIVRASDTIISTKATGAPFLVAASDLVTNLNADLLDGVDSTAFSQFGTQVDTAEMADLAVTAAKIAGGAIDDSHVNASAAIAGSKVVPDFGAQDVMTLGQMGVGTAPGLSMQLDVAGIVRASDTIISTKSGGAPFLVAASGLVTNLNADLLDGVHSSAFSQFGSLVDTAEIADLAVTAAKLDPSVDVWIDEAGDTMTGTLTLNPGAGQALDLSTGSIYKAGALFIHTEGGPGNTAFGLEALTNVTGGRRNVASGYKALYSNTSGTNNAASGHKALTSNTTGGGNTASGNRALYSNEDGSDNTACGNEALSSNTSGSKNTASGYKALYSNEDGDFNTAIGSSALFANTHGFRNTASGYKALYSNMTGGGNTASGFWALYSNTTGGGNTATGDEALSTNTYGNGNTASGRRALFSNTGGNGNTASGYKALYSNDSSFNTAIGHRALFSNTTGFSNTASGYTALFSNTTGSSNTASGYKVLYSNTTGSGNTASGHKVLHSNTTGSGNTASGHKALSSNTIGHDNTAVGKEALHNNTFDPLNPTSPSDAGHENTAIGSQALRFNTTGSDNTASGVFALVNNTTGSSNTASGFAALFYNMSGSSNTASGYLALYNNTTGNGNIALGSGAGGNVYTGSDNIFIGSAGDYNDDRTIRIGEVGTHTKTFIAGISGVTSSGGVGVFVNGSGQLGTVTSSRRFKEEIRDMGEATERLLGLRPVVFRYKPEVQSGERPIEYGLIAEEVAEVFPELVVHDEEGQPLTVKYHLLSSMLLNELQKEHEQVVAQHARSEALHERAEAQAGELEELRAEVQRLRALEVRVEVLEAWGAPGVHRDSSQESSGPHHRPQPADSAHSS